MKIRCLVGYGWRPTGLKHGELAMIIEGYREVGVWCSRREPETAVIGILQDMQEGQPTTLHPSLTLRLLTLSLGDHKELYEVTPNESPVTSPKQPRPPAENLLIRLQRELPDLMQRLAPPVQLVKQETLAQAATVAAVTQ